MLIWNYFYKHVKKWLITLIICNSKTKLEFERASQRVNYSINGFAAYFNNLYAQLENFTLEVVKIQYLRIKYNKKFIKKRNDLILNMIILCRYAKIMLVLNNSCNRCINCWINLCNCKINRSTIEIKIKYFRTNEIIRLIQLLI